MRPLDLAIGGTTFILLLSFVSCSPTRSLVVLDTDRVGAAELLGLVRASSERLHSLTGKGSLSFEGPDVAGSAFFSLALKKPDSLLVKLEGPFGIDVGMLFLSRARFVVYNSLENRVIEGSPDTSSLRSLLPFELTVDQILEAFSGVFAIPGSAEEVRLYAIDDNLFHLTVACGSDTCDYWVDPSNLLVTKYQRKNSQGTLVIDAEASAVTEQNDTYAPRKVTITFPESDKRVSVYYTTIVLNDPHPLFTYSIPRDARSTKQ